MANRINGVPRPAYWGYCCRYQLYRDADAVVCAGVKTCASTASSPIVKRNLPQMWKQGSSLHMCACAYLKWQSSVSHGGSMIESISRWSIDHATASSQNPHYSACRITYLICNIQIGGCRSWAAVVGGSPSQNWLKLLIGLLLYCWNPHVASSVCSAAPLTRSAPRSWWSH